MITGVRVFGAGWLASESFFLFLLYGKCFGVLVVVFFSIRKSNTVCRWLTAYRRSRLGDLLSEFCIHCFLNRSNYFTLPLSSPEFFSYSFYNLD